MPAAPSKRHWGVYVIIALLVVILFLLIAVLSLVGLTVTLPSIAGIVLTLGMSVDANILIYERIREELRRGMTPVASIQAGYHRALTTIIDANVATFIVGLILFTIGTSAVRAFAVTLMIGLVTSMLTGVMLTRVIVDFIYGRCPAHKRLSIGI